MSMPHPHLWPALIGAVLGFALIIVATLWLLRRWDTLAPRPRWAWFALIALFEAAYWLNLYAWLVEPNLLVVRQV